MVKDHSETRCRHMGYSFRVTRVLLYAPPHRQAFVTPVVEHWLEREIAQWVHSMKDRSDDPSRHEQTLLPRSYMNGKGVDLVFTSRFVATGEARSPQTNGIILVGTPWTLGALEIVRSWCDGSSDRTFMVDLLIFIVTFWI